MGTSLPHLLSTLRRIAPAGLACLSLLACTGRADAATTLSAPLAQLDSAASQTLQTYTTQSSPSDTRYYSNGVWSATDGPACWYCYDSAAVGAATLSQQPGGDQALESVAIATFDSDIANHQLPSGAIEDVNGNPDGIGTGFWAVNLGMTYLELQSSLDPATRTEWSDALANAAQYLINSGNTTWYANGNVELRQTEVLWLAWAVTHEPQFLTAYDAEYSFTIAPPQSRWPGFGLQLTTVPTLADGSDGAGYLAESGGGTPGFDPIYTDAQLDAATDLYVLTKDPKYLRLMNLLFNQLRPRIDSSWTLNGTGGTRENYMTPFMNPALYVLAMSGDRPDLVADVPGQLAHTAAQYQSAQSFTNVNFYKGFESWVSGPLFFNQWPQGMAVDTRVSTSPAPTTPSAAPTVTSSAPATAPVSLVAPPLTIAPMSVEPVPAASTAAHAEPAKHDPRAVKTKKKKKKKKKKPRAKARARQTKRRRAQTTSATNSHR